MSFESKKELREAMQEVKIETKEGKQFLDKHKDPASQTMEDYRRRMRYYLAYRGKNCKELVDEAEEDWNKGKRERDFASEHHMNNFLVDLKELGYSDNTRANILATWRAFYQFHQFPLNRDRLKDISRANESHHKTISKDDVRKLYNSTTSKRNKALLLFLYQTGQSPRQIVDLNYGDVKEELEDGKEPLMLRYSERKGTGNGYVTFLGTDGIEALRNYLEERGELEYDDPLFGKSKGEGRISRSAVPMILQYMAKKANLVDDEYLENNRNPYRPSAFRKNFKTQLTTNAHDFAIEYMMGHQVGIEKVYFIPDVGSEEDLRKYYAEYMEPELSIHTTTTEKQAIVNEEIEKIKGDEIRRIAEEKAKEMVEEGKEMWMDKYFEAKQEREILENEVEEQNSEVGELREEVRKLREKVEKIDKLGEMLESAGQLAGLKEMIREVGEKVVEED